MNPKIAVTQMRSTDDIDANFLVVQRLCEQAQKSGAQLVTFPENFAFLPKHQTETKEFAQPLSGALFAKYRELARHYSLEISYGGFPERDEHGRIFNAHVVVNASGEITATYRKIHLFVVTLTNSSFNEAATFEAGSEVVTVPSCVGTIGLSICYDLRFAELYASLCRKGAQVLLVPSAFTAETGKAHWEVLLRARAIENQCYVAAAAQFGLHHEGRVTHGHAMIVDPWGKIVAECSSPEGIVVAEINADYMQKVRQAIPVSSHRRPLLFGT